MKDYSEPYKLGVFSAGYLLTFLLIKDNLFLIFFAMPLCQRSASFKEFHKHMEKARI